MQVLQQNTLELRANDLKKASLIFRAINHKLRQQMVKLIHDQGRMTVTQIYIRLRLEQSVASQHLAILRKAFLVHTERDGKYIFYSLNYERLKQVQESAGTLI